MAQPETRRAVMDTFRLDDLPERFGAKVERDERTGCWEWRGARGLDGYGRFLNNGGRKAKPLIVRAHVFAYRKLVARYPEGLTLWHGCGNRLCVNPAHLNVIRRAEYDRRLAGWCQAGRHRLAEQGLNQYGRCWACTAEKRARLGSPRVKLPPTAARTHCPQGHEYTADNVVRYRGWRYCRECHRLRCAAWRARKAAA